MINSRKQTHHCNTAASYSHCFLRDGLFLNLLLDATLPVMFRCLRSAWCAAPFDCWVEFLPKSMHAQVRLPACATGRVYHRPCQCRTLGSSEVVFVTGVKELYARVIAQLDPCLSSSSQWKREPSCGMQWPFLQSTKLRYQTHFFRPGQWNPLLALAVFFMPVLTSNIGYANCTVNH